MPIYEYQCAHCGHHLEALQKLSDAPLRTCPECSKPALRKLVSAAGFRLKGGGWYETDFKSANKHNLAGGGETSSTEGQDKKEGKEKKEGKDKKIAAPAEAKKTGGKTAESKPDSKPAKTAEIK